MLESARDNRIGDLAHFGGSFARDIFLEDLVVSAGPGNRYSCDALDYPDHV
jgi:hypothetical protein